MQIAIYASIWLLAGLQNFRGPGARTALDGGCHRLYKACTPALSRRAKAKAGRRASCSWARPFRIEFRARLRSSGQAGRQADRQTDGLHHRLASSLVQFYSRLDRQALLATRRLTIPLYPSVDVAMPHRSAPWPSLSLSLSPACDITSEVRAQSSVVEMCRGHDAVEWKLGSDAGPGQQQCLVGAAGSTLGWCRIFGISRPLAWHGLGFDC